MVTLYNIPQVVNCVLPGALHGVKMTLNYPLNRSDFVLTRGVTNEVDFFIRDIDRHPANLTGSTVQITIVDRDAQVVLMTRNLTVFDATQAIYRLTVQPSETLDWPLGSLDYSLTLVRPDTSTIMLWTSMNYQPRGSLTLVPGPVPPPANPVTIIPSTLLYSDIWAVSSRIPCAAQLGYNNGAQTVSVPMQGFTGTVRIEGSIAAQPSGPGDWYVLVQRDYSVVSATQTLTTRGNHLWLRVSVSLALDTSVPNTVAYRLGSAGSLGSIAVRA